MQKSNVKLLIYIKGQSPAFEYTSRDFKTYIEGRDGSDFEIEVVNDNPYRIEALVTVDSLSVLDGKPAGDDSRGYVVEARSKIRIPGWKLNGQEAAKFFFSGRKNGSYVEKSTGEATNKGVIGLMAFSEKPAPYTPPYTPTPIGWPSYGPNSAGWGAQLQNQLLGSSHAAVNNMSGVSLSNSSVSGGLGVKQSFSSGTTGRPREEMKKAGLSTRGLSKGGGATAQASMSAEPVEQTLGAGFGARTDFNTSTTTFVRGDMIAMLVMFYDDRRGLEKRGIEMVRPSQTRYSTTPNPFPNYSGNGCEPPSGWSGR